MEQLLESLEDPDEAIKKAEQLLEEDGKDGVYISKIRQGRKRHPGFGVHRIKPLPGVQMSTASRIRIAVGLRYGGFSDALIERTMGWGKNYVFKTEIKHPQAFERAREELLKSAVSEYQQNVTMSRAALSDSAMKAVNTLDGIMDDGEAKTSERLRASELVLKLTMGQKSQSPGEMAGEIISSFGDALAKVSKASSRQNSYIQDAEVIDVEADSLDN